MRRRVSLLTVALVLVALLVPAAPSQDKKSDLILGAINVLVGLLLLGSPIAAAFAQVEPSLREASVILGASSLRTFLRITLPLSIEGVIAGLVLSFAHTVGEFGVVLMVGGNLPGITRTVSIAIYDQVQALQYREANLTALVLLAFSFVVLLAVYGLRRRPLAAAPLA